MDGGETLTASIGRGVDRLGRAQARLFSCARASGANVGRKRARCAPFSGRKVGNSPFDALKKPYSARKNGDFLDRLGQPLEFGVIACFRYNRRRAAITSRSPCRRARGLSSGASLRGKRRTGRALFQPANQREPADKKHRTQKRTGHTPQEVERRSAGGTPRHQMRRPTAHHCARQED